MSVRVPAAVIGLSGVMPGSIDLAAFWQHLLAGDEMISEVPADRWDWRDYLPDYNAGREAVASPRGGFIPGADGFDAELFGLSPREAACLDPQQRLLLCSAWEAFESAALSPAALGGSRCGVFIGASGSDFKANLEQAGQPRALHQAPGTHQTMLANRLSFQFDLRGPSETIDTACSSSLVAIHRALRLIDCGDIDLALAGGIHLMLNPEMSVQYSRAGMLSPDGRCHTFDHRANGYVRAEGLGLVVLKRLDRALEDGDPIHGVLVGSAENHGGRATSLTAPNPKAQTALIVESLRSAGLGPEAIGLVEAHGTGTPLGDPIEVNALKTAFAELGYSADRAPWCWLGAVKTAVGHLEAAAGMAGLFKALFAICSGHIPGNLNLERRNPHVSLDDSPLRLPEGTQTWPAECPEARFATVSSFGFGGVNAHVVAGPAPQRPAPAEQSDTLRLFVLSAPDRERLAAQAAALLDLPLLAPHRPASTGRTWLARLQKDLAARPGMPMPATRGNDFASLGLTAERLFEHLVDTLGLPPEAADSALRDSHDLASLARRLDQFRPVTETGLCVRRLPCHFDAGAVGFDALAWTLATGRHVFDERAAIVAGSPEALAQALAALIDDANTSDGLFLGNPRRDAAPIDAHRLAWLPAALRDALAQWLGKRRPRINWHEQYHEPPARCSIPGVALRLKPHPLGNTDGHLRTDTVVDPLLGDNRSGIAGLGFEKRLTAADRLWLSPERASPLSSGLVLLAAAMSASARLAQGHQTNFRAFAWAAPVRFAVGDRIDIRLLAAEGSWFVELSRSGGDGETRLLLQGEVMPDAATSATAFDAEWIARLTTAIAAAVPDDATRLAPYRLERIALEPGSDPAALRVAPRPSAPGEASLTLDIVAGSWRMDGLELRRIGTPETGEALPTLAAPAWTPAAAPTPTQHDGVLCLAVGQTIDGWPGTTAGDAALIVSADFDPTDSAAWHERLADALDGRRLRRPALLISAADWLAGEAPADPLHAQRCLLALGRCSLTRLGLTRLDVVVHLPAGDHRLDHLSAWAATLRHEDDMLAVHLLRIDDGPHAARLLAEASASDSVFAEWREGTRHVPALAPCPAPGDDTNLLADARGGSVLVSGGYGALSSALAEHLARAHGATVWLCGRRSPDPVRDANWRQEGLAIHYRQADAADLDSMGRLIAEIEAGAAPLRGVVHCAGVTRDCLTSRKSLDDLSAVCRSKTLASRVLDEATGQAGLRFFVLFGSVVGRFGNPGQADYGSANAWLADFARRRMARVAAGERHGHSVCIDWPYWSEGGMRLESEQLDAFSQRHGLQALPTQVGLKLLETALRLRLPHLVALYGTPEAIRQHLATPAGGTDGAAQSHDEAHA